ncbi:malectin domain-containing carbohydrate-binding protein [Lunatimonas salinarum]|uniref:malectin domain-containing carbohydrate-binding protein n=1 Tax=Lunatimonas salinarum TaxID=1774590 RepID=UPI001ADF8DA3|nr:malectin domain-containing carbohydrate-binding protein [Lunatimonas salinarum]
MKASLAFLVTIIALWSGFSSQPVEAANYYFSSSVGDDSRTDAQAQNPNTPWKSIDKLNAVIRNLQPGDNVYFRRGDTFHGTITISRAGSPGSPIRFGAYGSGDSPIITSFVTLSNWSSRGNGVFDAAIPNLRSTAISVVLVNNQVQEMGRFPNSDATNKGYITYESVSGSNTIVSQSLSSSPNWTGGEVVMRKIFWITDRHRITSHNGNSLSFANNPETSYSPRAGYGFFVQNHPQTLDKFGEWYFNPSNRRLHLFLGNNQPNNTKVEVATHDYLVNNSTSVRDVVFENLHFRGANKDLISFSAGNNLSIQNCVFEYAGASGLELNEMGNSRMLNSRVSNVNDIGVNLRFSQNFTLRNNTIENIYLMPGMGLSGDNRGLGVFAVGNNVLVENNRILNSGYIGIRFGGNNTVVKENYIDQFCLTKNDGGGIYAYSNRFTKNSGRRVINNIILNGVGVIEGTDRGFTLSRPQAEGIYLDDNVNGVEVSGNTIGNITSKGIYLHNTENIQVRNNTIYNSNYLIFLRNDNMGNPLTNNLFEGNKLLIDSPFQQFIHVYSIYNDVPQLADFNNNYFASPFYDDYRIQVKYNAGTSNEVNQLFNLNSWRNAYGKDRNSYLLTKKIDLVTTKSTIGQNKIANGSFNSNVTGYLCSNCTASWDNSGQLNGGSMRVDTRRNTMLSTISGPLTLGKTYRVKFTARGNTSHHLSLYFRHSGSPWQPISATQSVEIVNERRDYEVFIQPIETVENSRLMMTSPDPSNFHFFIDNIEVHEVDVDKKKPSDYVLFEYNQTTGTSGIPLVGQFVDVRNTQYSGSVQLAPYSSVLLIKSDAGTIDKVEKPTVTLNLPQNTSSWIEGNTIQLSISSNISDTNISRVEYFNNGTRIGMSETAPFGFNWSNIPAGTHNLSAKLTDVNGQFADSDPIRINALQKATESASGFSLYLNIGSSQSTAISGVPFTGENSGQSYHQNSRIFTITDNQIDQLFTSERFGTTMRFSIPLPNGTYVVRTLHNELWFGKNGPPASQGQRVYSILMEGRTVKSNFDLFLENGNNPIVLTFNNIDVTDGVLDLSFNAVSDNPTISGIAIDHIGNNISPLTPTLNTTSPVGPSPRPTINPIYLNAGSLDDVTYLNSVFRGDESSSFPSPSRTSQVLDANVPDLFKTERFSRSFSYDIPVPNGAYTVVTYHNELWFGLAGPSAAPGRRIFNIALEGQSVKENIDLFVENANRPTAFTFKNIQVEDGVLTLSLLGVRENATISGLAIIPEGATTDITPIQPISVNPIFINVGSFSGTAYQGIDFQGDDNLEYFDLRSRTTLNNDASGIELFRSERFQSNLTYTIPVPTGSYDVFTFHNELWFGHRGPTAAPGRRVFDIYLENRLVKSNFDLFIENGNRETTLRFSDILVEDGFLNLSLLASQNNATLSGLAIIPKNQSGIYNLRTYGEDEFSFDGVLESNMKLLDAAFTLYPNPASHSAVLQVSENISIKGIGVYATNGQLVKYINPANGSESAKTFVLPLDDVKDGVYILNIHTANEQSKKLRLIVKH